MKQEKWKSFSKWGPTIPSGPFYFTLFSSNLFLATLWLSPTSSGAPSTIPHRPCRHVIIGVDMRSHEPFFHKASYLFGPDLRYFRGCSFVILFSFVVSFSCSPSSWWTVPWSCPCLANFQILAAVAALLHCSALLLTPALRSFLLIFFWFSYLFPFSPLLVLI